MRALASLSLFVLLGCRSHDTPPDSKGTTPSSVVWDGAGPFAFVTSDFHVQLGGTQVTEVKADGAVRDLFVESSPRNTEEYCAGDLPERRYDCEALRRLGSAEFSDSTWYVARFTLGPADLARLRELLVRARVAEQVPSDHDERVVDGTTRTYTLVTALGSHKLSRYQRPPPPSLQPALQWLDAQKAAHHDARQPASAAERQELEALAR